MWREATKADTAQDLSKSSVPTSFVGMGVPTIRMLVVLVLPIEVVGMSYVIFSIKYKIVKTFDSMDSAPQSYS